MPVDRRILVIRLGAFGDILHTLPAVATLRHGIPGAQITWMVAPQWQPLLEGNPHIDRVVTFDRHSMESITAAATFLRRERFPVAIDFQGLIKSSVLIAASRAARRIGFAAEFVREKQAAWFYSEKITPTALHVVEQNIELAFAAGAGHPVLDFPLPAGKAEGRLPVRPFVLACPLAGWPAKQWPPEYYSELAFRLDEEYGMALVLNGAPKHEPELRAIRGAWTHVSGLDGLIDATRKAAAVIGLDSGPMHLAAAMNKPGLALFGPTDPARNGPYGDSLRVLRDEAAVTSYKRLDRIDPAMSALTPAVVFDALTPCLITASPSHTQTR